VAMGALIGVAGGAAAGASLYFGLTRIPARLLFTVTNWMILLLLAGMAAQATGFLVQAGYVPPIVEPLWDTSWLLSDRSILGRVMHTLTGYQARPAGIQVLVYALSFISVAVLTRLNTPTFVPVAKAAAAALLGVVAAGIISPQPATAGEFKLRYPNIDYREIEIENTFAVTFDKQADRNHNVTAPVKAGMGILPFWFTEVEFEFVNSPGKGTEYEAFAFENYFMLTEPGKNWLDMGLFVEYERARPEGDPDKAAVALLFQKEANKALHTLNLGLEKQVGRFSEDIDTFKYAWQSRYMLHPMFQPGFEFYGEIEDIAKPGKFDDQAFRIGPMFAGSLSLSQIGGVGKIKYEAGYLFGLTDATEDGVLRTKLEYEIGF
jgi:hypothetical protein